MAVDMQQLQAIHHLQGEVSEADREVKTLVEDYEQQLADLPEQQAVAEAERTLKEARDRLKITIASDPDLAKLADQIDEAKFKRRDLGEILSHHLVVYHDETGRDVIKDREATTRAIEFKAKLGSRRSTSHGCPLASADISGSTPDPRGYEGRGEAGGGGVMERNVVSLETAKKLKAVGFPRVSMWHYSEGMNPPDELFFTQSSGSTHFDIAAPTAQEIADQLPGFWSVMNSKATSNYHAAYHGSGGGRLNAVADTLAEVLADLLLKLVESGDLKLHEAHS